MTSQTSFNFEKQPHIILIDDIMQSLSLEESLKTELIFRERSLQLDI